MNMLIGLTGKTGSGKSSAAKTFEKLGAYVADCDRIAHSTLQDCDVKEKLKNAFSDSIFDNSGNVDRKKLGKIVFSDKAQLKTLNSIMHKAIVDKAVEACENSGKDICILDGSELESSGADEKCAHIIVIVADEDIRLQRIMERDGIDKDSALLRIHAQKDYSKSAIFVENNADASALEKKITELYNKFNGEINANVCK